MKRLQAFCQQQAERMLAKQPIAMLYALAFALLPYTSWISIVIIALITLRKGWQEGFVLLVPVFVLHFGCSLATIPFAAALLNSMLLLVPCFAAACVLRWTTHWQGVACFFFIAVSFIALLVQLFYPELVIIQYQYVLAVLKASHAEGTLSHMLASLSETNERVLASYAFGIQLLSVVFSAVTSLAMARSMQSRLFNPGGFRHELMTFKATKLSILIAGLLCGAAAIEHNMVAMMLLPVVFFYFLLAGLSLTANALLRKNMRLVLLILLAPLFFLPFVMVPLYGMLGLLDSLFNLRQLNRKKEEVQ